MRDIRHEPIVEHFIFRSLVYEPHYTIRVQSGLRQLAIQGPFCPKDRANLTYKDESNPHGGVKCTVCATDYESALDLPTLREMAKRAYEAKERQKINIISLDLPPTLVKAETENNDYWIEARLGQRQGKLQGVIYLGKKVKGVQAKTDYAHIIIDTEEEQMRFDKGNRNPMDLLAQIQIEFKKSKVKQELK